MSSRSISAFAPSLFSQARQHELSSIMQRGGAREAECTSEGPASTDRNTRSLRIYAMDEPGTDCAKLRSLSDCASPVFHLAATANGCWEIREQKGTKVGWFRTRQAAIKYARDESPNGNFVIIDDLSDVA